MLDGDAEAVWGRVDEQTHTYFAQSYEKLERMGEAIERYLPQSDHRLAQAPVRGDADRGGGGRQDVLPAHLSPEKLPRMRPTGSARASMRSR